VRLYSPGIKWDRKGQLAQPDLKARQGVGISDYRLFVTVVFSPYMQPSLLVRISQMHKSIARTLMAQLYKELFLKVEIYLAPHLSVLI